MIISNFEVNLQVAVTVGEVTVESGGRDVRVGELRLGIQSPVTVGELSFL